MKNAAWKAVFVCFALASCCGLFYAVVWWLDSVANSAFLRPIEFAHAYVTHLAILVLMSVWVVGVVFVLAAILAFALDERAGENEQQRNEAR